ncbi:hypothetical protein [Brevibacterium luteolum]|uniref:YfhO family protein n=1 Tax=Brevibacterium luteolum TaxID=199591 RepID=A0A6G8KU92_9MICO|nr:hypothetical protein [Brevibacterium luteolum]QIN28359.1 hypothetical protein EW640_03030 [Brevibacterium luteolum]
MRSPQRTRFTRPVRDWGLYALFLLAWSCVIYWQLLTDLSGSVFAHNDDPSLFIWWFAHAADVVASWFGQGSGETNLLFTQLMNYPTGVNGAWNTSVIGIAVPMVPITWLFGPIVAYNIAIMLAAPASALAAALLIRQFTTRGPAFLGGFSYGFSTYVVAQSAGHLNLAVALTPPLVAYGLIRLARCHSLRRSFVIGLCLGVLLGWQLYVSSELAAGLSIAGIVFCLIAAIVLARRYDAAQRRAGLTRLLTGGAAAAVTALLIGLPLILTMLTSPGAPQQTIRPQGVWNNDLLEVVFPSQFTLLGGPDADPLPRVQAIDPAEIGAYLGFFWLAFAILTTVLLWNHRRLGPLVRITALTALVMWMLSLGSPWFFAGREVLAVGPYHLIEALPVLGNVLPMRLAIYPTLAAAVLLAVGMHQVLRTREKQSRLLALTQVTSAVIVIAVSTGPVSARQVPIPEFYASAYAEHLPAGSVVKTMPRPIALAAPDADVALVWQALTGMHYRETGGYFIGSTDTSPIVFGAQRDALDERLRQPIPGDPEVRARAASETVAALRAEGIDFVVIGQDVAHLPAAADQIAAFVAEGAGSPVQNIDGVFLIDVRSC